ncbi:hypothetical protein H8356DRAFT_1041189 [Neocallimastix lanati (nom. inval.)]|jgi:CBS domain-containing protein|uniref:CBS domain-containing protein n=1 Tax=Neocallimastix californiae TaxID=1754190 RepID=A0A1Y2BXF8_9FUNG|nr:hypothetical protein H8356DRAFT_1041189 [Neocallimastix sp. JGI-2020a]ORY39460.1 hypothetical protein LY90DRAFT_672424 [Neocallimastix californiae]|eukprot:ORY39460.1 hypothetical protein LY90DRAFT_672424 [Neocallimastix californiae]
MAFPLFEGFINSHTIKDLIEERSECTLIDTEENTTIQEVYNKFLEYNLRCLPIYRIENNTKNYIGYITLFDLIPEQVLRTIKKECQDNGADIDEVVDSFDYFEQPVKNFLKKINLELKIIPDTLTINELINILSKYNHHCLVKSSNDNYQVVSQYDLVHYLFGHIEKFDEELLDQQADECAGLVLRKYLNHVEGKTEQNDIKNVDFPEFVKISYKKTALDGFILMIEKKVECIAITDDNGLTISVLTSGNIRGLNPEALKEVIKPILPFLKSALDDVPEPYTCTENYTIIQLMTKLMHYQTRRLIVVGREGLPTSIVSMSDIVSALNVEERKEVY